MHYYLTLTRYIIAEIKKRKEEPFFGKSMNIDEVPELHIIWDEAKGHIDRGDYDKAVEIYKYVLIRYADNAIATNGLSFIINLKV